ncbi:MAG: twin-arginine translocase TatA/TatE family subunit [Pyrinomonadaceae bacterium]
MNYLMLIGMPGTTEMIIILAVVLLIFGGSKLPQLAKALGQSKRAFKEGMDDADEAERKDRATPQLSGDARSSIAGISDEELFEEARRRAQEAKR